MGKGRKVVAGSIGAVIGFVGTLFGAGLFETNDPITTGVIVLVVFAPLGAFICAWLAVSMVSGGETDKPPA